MLPVQDAEKCLELAPTFAKGYSRKGAAQFFMKEFDKARPPARPTCPSGGTGCGQLTPTMQLTTFPCAGGAAAGAGDVPGGVDA